MKIIKLLSLTWLAIFAVSCSSDDSDGQQSSNIAYYTVAYKTVFNGSPINQSMMRANIINNKLFSETQLDPVTFAEMESIQLYHYNGSQLASVNTGFTAEEFFYDAAGQVKARNYYTDTADNNYQQYIFMPGNIVYVEGLTAPFDHQDAEVFYRIVVKFDADDNLVEAGFDDDMDGTAENAKTYFYENGNLVHAETGNGAEWDFTYSNVVNNFSFLQDNTFGKRLSRLRYAGAYASGSIYSVASHSRNIKTEILSQSQYELADNGFFRKSVATTVFEGGQATTTTEFYFN